MLAMAARDNREHIQHLSLLLLARLAVARLELLEVRVVPSTHEMLPPFW